MSVFRGNPVRSMHGGGSTSSSTAYARNIWHNSVLFQVLWNFPNLCGFSLRHRLSGCFSRHNAPGNWSILEVNENQKGKDSSMKNQYQCFSTSRQMILKHMSRKAASVNLLQRWALGAEWGGRVSLPAISLIADHRWNWERISASDFLFWLYVDTIIPLAR